MKSWGPRSWCSCFKIREFEYGIAGTQTLVFSTHKCCSPSSYSVVCWVLCSFCWEPTRSTMVKHSVVPDPLSHHTSWAPVREVKSMYHLFKIYRALYTHYCTWSSERQWVILKKAKLNWISFIGLLLHASFDSRLGQGSWINTFFVFKGPTIYPRRQKGVESCDTMWCHNCCIREVLGEHRRDWYFLVV